MTAGAGVAMWALREGGRREVRGEGAGTTGS